MFTKKVYAVRMHQWFRNAAEVANWAGGYISVKNFNIVQEHNSHI